MIGTLRHAIEAVARHARENSNVFVRDGQKMLSTEEESLRQSYIECLADDLDRVGAKATVESVTYREFESILTALHHAGFFPPSSFISNVAQAFHSRAD